jgi:hypothetical protein
MTIFYVDKYFESYYEEPTFVLYAQGVTNSTYCWATVCETTADEVPTYSDATVGIGTCGPYDVDEIGVRVLINPDAYDTNRNYRVRAFWDDFGVNTQEVFSVLGDPATGGAGSHRYTIEGVQWFSDPGLVWASVCEYDPTGQNPKIGDAVLSVQQVVPGATGYGCVDVWVWIDNVSADITYRVTVFGLI